MSMERQVIEMEKAQLMKDYPGADNPLGKISFEIIYRFSKEVVSKSVSSVQRQSGVDKDYSGIFFRMFEIVCKELLLEKHEKSNGT